MIVRQYELACLSHYSYLVGDEQSERAVVIDPQRDIGDYLADARVLGLTIERVIETHVHADFLSGHLELADATGAVVSLGPGADVDYPVDRLDHGRRLQLGEVVLEVRHTPGHTPESVSLVAYEHADDADPCCVFTGDTLFVGDVGRPDLVATVDTGTHSFARLLYRSVHEQLLTLPDATRVYPAHGAGSSCGRSLGDTPSSTIGEQRRTNPALQPMSEADFVAFVTAGQPVAPLHFAYTADQNRRIHHLFDDTDPPRALTVEEVEEHLASGTLVIDGRWPDAFAAGHLRGSVNVGLDGRFAEYAGDVARRARPVVVVTDPGRESEAKLRLARVGLDDVVGAVGDIEAVLDERPDLGARSVRVDAAELAAMRGHPSELQLVDVRNPAEHERGVIPGAILSPLARLLEDTSALDPAATTVVYCGSGYRSSTVASALRAGGFADVSDLVGGYEAWTSAGRPVTVPV